MFLLLLGLQRSFIAHRLSGALSLFQIPFGAAPRGEALMGIGGTPDAGIRDTDTGLGIIKRAKRRDNCVGNNSFLPK